MRCLKFGSRRIFRKRDFGRPLREARSLTIENPTCPHIMSVSVEASLVATIRGSSPSSCGTEPSGKVLEGVVSSGVEAFVPVSAVDSDVNHKCDVVSGEAACADVPSAAEVVPRKRLPRAERKAAAAKELARIEAKYFDRQAYVESLAGGAASVDDGEEPECLSGDPLVVLRSWAPALEVYQETATAMTGSGEKLPAAASVGNSA